jgi:hypothetical protein
MQYGSIEGAMELSGNRSSIAAEELSDRYLLLTNSPVKDATLNAAGELVQILLKTQWVEIALIRCLDAEAVVDMDVEVSIPKKQRLRDEDRLAEMATHINYLKRLVELEFVLTIIREDCLWIASRTFLTQPEMDVFDALLPP